MAYRILNKVPAWRSSPESWPSLVLDALPPAQQSHYLRRKNAIWALLKHATYEEIERETGIKRRMVRYLLDLCLADNGDGDIRGFRALLYGQEGQRSYLREAPITRDRKAGRGGCSGALTRLFQEHPEIQERLVQEILKSLPEGEKLAEARISVTHLHDVFIRLCKDVGLEDAGAWPFCTKTWGITSIRIFVQQLKKEEPARYIRARFGADASRMTHVGTGKIGLFDPGAPYDVVGLDELRFDAIATVTIQVAGEAEQDIPIECIHIILMVERRSSAILSWLAFFSASVQTADLRKVLAKALVPWSPYQFTIPGLVYETPDCGMPSGVINGLGYHGWCALMVDNALAHQDRTLLADISRHIGCLVNLGPVGAWYRRAHLERRIKDVLVNSAQRLPSTTGSEPKDTRKENPVEMAVKLKIRWKDVEQLVEATIARENAKSNEGLGFLSPMSVLRQVAESGDKGFLRRPLPKARQNGAIGRESLELTVRGNFEKGRRPSVMLDRGRYTNEALAQAWHLIGKKIRCEVDPENYGEMDAAVIGTGQSLGTLVVGGAWAKRRHTREMRKAVNRLKHDKSIVLLRGEDPIDVYLRHLAQQATKESRSRSGKSKVSKAAAKIAAMHDYVSDSSVVSVPSASVLPDQVQQPGRRLPQTLRALNQQTEGGGDDA